MRFTSVKQLEDGQIECRESKTQTSVIDLEGLKVSVAELKAKYEKKQALLDEIEACLKRQNARKK